MATMSDDRYSKTEFANCEQPNNFLKQQLIKIPKRTILFPAQGEASNAVYAATKGWYIDAFDLSIEGKKKALQLATKHDVSINYRISDFQLFDYKENKFDAMGLMYAHFTAKTKSIYHKTLTNYLRPSRIVIF
jgi:hypothetical protein